MDKHEIALSVLSVSSPGTQFLPIEDNRRLCRQLNEELDAIVQAHPRRFANLAALPLPDVDAALKEVDFAFNRGFDGIGLFSSYEGKYLGDPLFDPVLEKLNDRGATIFIHPAQPAAFDKIGLGAITYSRIPIRQHTDADEPAALRRARPLRQPEARRAARRRHGAVPCNANNRFSGEVSRARGPDRHCKRDATASIGPLRT
jgi:predicted TIM-barrel fold metal-dependent hydrolase